MLPFEDRPWAKPVARFMIAFSAVVVVVGLIYLHSLGPLDTAEITGAVLILLAVIPPNISVLRSGGRRFHGTKQALHGTR